MAATPVLGLGIFCGYMYWLTGNPLQWAEMHAAWGRRFTGLRWLLTPIHYMWVFGPEEYVRSETANAFNLLAVAFSLVLLIPVTRRLGLAYGVFIVANLIPPLTRGGLLSMHGRYHVSLSDIRALATPILRHRIITNFYAESEQMTSEGIVSRLIEAVPPPKSGLDV